MGRLSAAFVFFFALSAFAAAAQRGGGSGSAAGHAAPSVSHTASPSAHAGARSSSATSSGARAGSTVLHARNRAPVTRRANNGFDSFNGTDFQNVPGLGFDFPFLAATSGNHRGHGRRFSGADFGFSGFLLSPPLLAEGGSPVIDSEQSAAADDPEFSADPSDSPRPRRRSRASAVITDPQPESASAPLPEPEQYVFVRRDGSLVFAVGYTWENGTLRYITPDGTRRSLSRDALDISATQQFNEQRGLTFRVPA